LIAFLVHEYFTPELQKDARYITREVVSGLLEADSFDDDEVFLLGNVHFFFANAPCQKGTTRANHIHPRSILLVENHFMFRGTPPDQT